MTVSRGRILVAALSLSAAGFVGLLQQEGYTDTAVIPVPGDVPTIGFGTTEGVHLGDRITPPKAVARALNDIQKYEGAMHQCVTVPLHQAEYDVFLSTAYNVGPGAFCKSTLVKKLNTGDYRGACDELLRWRFFQGRDCSKTGSGCAGLWKRRQDDRAKCLDAQ